MKYNRELAFNFGVEGAKLSGFYENPTEYPCPICLSLFPNNTQVLTDEHVPPIAWGGIRTTPVCHTCNCGFGTIEEKTNKTFMLDNFYMKKEIKDDLVANLKLKGVIAPFQVKLNYQKEKLIVSDGKRVKGNEYKSLSDYFSKNNSFTIENLTLSDRLLIKETHLGLFKSAYLFLSTHFDIRIIKLINVDTIRLFLLTYIIANEQNESLLDKMDDDSFTGYLTPYLCLERKKEINFPFNDEGIYVNLDAENKVFIIILKHNNQPHYVTIPINFFWKVTDKRIMNEGIFTDSDGKPATIYPIFIRDSEDNWGSDNRWRYRLFDILNNISSEFLSKEIYCGLDLRKIKNYK